MGQILERLLDSQEQMTEQLEAKIEASQEKMKSRMGALVTRMDAHQTKSKS
jgi:hypothetical protein